MNVKYVNALVLEFTNFSKFHKTLNINNVVTELLQPTYVCILRTVWHKNERALRMYIYINIPIISFIQKL